MADLIVLGGGPAGYCAAERAAAAGMNVRLIEKRALGGVCLNEGCIPSKTLLNSAKILHYAQDGSAFGVTAENAKADVSKIIARKNSVVKKLVAGVGAQMKRHGVQVTYASGVVKGKGNEGYIVEAGGETFTAQKLLIASGSVPVIPNIPGVKGGLEAGYVWTNQEALDATTIPARFVVIGGGVIGMEMASYYQSMGAQVTVVEMLPTIGGPIDADLAKALLKSYTAAGISFQLNSRVTQVDASGVTFECDGKSQTIPADQVLMCIGRRANTQDMGYETINLHMERGAVITDESGRTNLPNVYAAGDVNGKSMLAHTAYREAECAVAAMLDRPQRVSYDAIPSVIYTTPEVACVGLTDKQAKDQGYDCKTITLPMSYSGRYLAETDNGEGFVKLVADQKSRRLLGIHMIGSYASEIIYGAAIMVATQMPIEALRQFVFPHPTVAEILREALWEI